MTKYLYNFQKICRCLFFKLQLLIIFVFCVQTLNAQENKVDERLLVIGAKTERKVVGQELHAYGIQLKRGQVLRVILQEKGADVIAGIEYFANSQSMMASAVSNSGSGFTQESITAIAEQDGLYKLSVIAKQTDEGVDARYEFTASVSDSATTNDTRRMEAEVLLFAAGQVAAANDKEKMSLAITELEKSVKTWQSLGDRYWEAITRNIIGNLAFKVGEIDKAETDLLQALNLFDKVKNKAEIANIYTTLGAIYASKSDDAKAGKYFNDALVIFRSIDDKRSEKAYSGINSQSLRDLANKNSSSNSKKKKSVDFERKLNEAKRKNDEAAQVAVWTKYLFAVVFEEAIDANFDFKQMTIEEIRQSGRIIEEKIRRTYEKAESEGLRLARKLKDKNAEMQMLVVLGFGYADLDDEEPNEDSDEKNEEKPQIKNSEKSKNHLIQGLTLSKILNDKIFEFMAYGGLSEMYDDENDKLGIFFGKKFVNSIHSYRKTFVNMANREEQQMLAKQTEGLYGILANMLTEENRLEEALQVVNLGRDQEFFDYKLIDDQSTTKLSLTKNESDNELYFDNFLKDLTVKYASRPNANYSSADGIQEVFTTLENNFKDDVESENDIVRNVKDAEDMKAALDELSKKTGKNHVAIYYVNNDGEDSEFLLVTAKDIKSFSRGWETIPEEYAKNPDDIYTDFLGVLTSPNFDARPLGSVIYKSIFKSVETYKEEEKDTTLEVELEKVKAQVIHWSLTGKIRYIPLAALYDEERKQYLVEQYENVMFTRAKKESFLIPPKRWTTGIGFGRTFANDLPFVREELSAIFGDDATNQKALFTGNVFINEKFNVDSLLTIRLTKPDFVHIASHFKFQPGEAGQSVLLLGDGKLFSLSEMQLSGRLFDGVDLLTLSACETAVQREDASGKEIDGFAELAQRLGAKSVIATLWSIEDTSASKLMAEFYRLKQENPDASKAEVLRLAQMTLLNGENSWDEGLKNRGIGNVNKTKTSPTTNKYTQTSFTPDVKAKFSHPYYWAAYVLYGGSNDGKLTKTYTIPKPPTRQTSGNINTESSNLSENRNSIAGNWSGKYACGQGITGVTLKILQNGNEVQGLFEFYPLPENPTFKPGAGTYKGEFNPVTGFMYMNGGRWLVQPDVNWILVDFSGSFDQNRQIFTGRMLNPSCGGIELRREDSQNNTTTSSSTLTEPQNNPVTLKELEISFQAKLFDETIRKARIFLTYEPENKDAHAYLGYALMIRNNIDEAVPHLAKAILLGEPIPFYIKRGRPNPLGLGQMLTDGQITISRDGIVIVDGGKNFQASFNSLSNASLDNFNGSCPVAFFQGMFVETRTRSDKTKADNKSFALFPQAATLVTAQQGNLTVFQISCFDTGIVPTTIIKLIAELRARQ